MSQITGGPGSQAVQKQSSDLTDEELAFVECFALGMKPNEIAKQVEPKDPQRRKVLRNRLRRMLRTDPRISQQVGQIAKATMVVGVGPATDALVRRAAKGRPDAIKLLYEASGFHNPKVQHEHSGDISVTLNMPRPPARVENESADDDVVDADVVEE